MAVETIWKDKAGGWSLTKDGGMYYLNDPQGSLVGADNDRQRLLQKFSHLFGRKDRAASYANGQPGLVSVQYKVNGVPATLGMPEGDIPDWKARMAKVWGDKFQFIKFTNSYANGQSKAYQAIQNKMSERLGNAYVDYSDISKWEDDAKARGYYISKDNRTGTYKASKGAAIDGIFITHPSAGTVGGKLKAV